MASQKLKDFAALALGTVIGTTVAVIILALILSALLDRYVRSLEPAMAPTSMLVILPPPGILPTHLVPKPGMRIRIADRPELGGPLECIFDHWVDESSGRAQMTDCR